MRTLGVDVSHYQDKPPNRRGAPISALAKDGARFVIAKASQSGFADPSYAVNARRIAARKSIVGGAYHFLDEGTGADQADAFLRVVGDPAGLVCVLDVEASGNPYREVRAFIERWRARTHDHPLLLYTSRGYWLGHGNVDASELGCDLWLAYYTLNHQPLAGADVSSVSFRAGFGGWDRAVMVQFGPVLVDGRRYDGDVFDGTLAELRAYGAPRARPPLTERPQYKLGYNGMVTRIEDILALQQPHAVPGHPANEAGQKQALEDAAAAVAGLRIREVA